MSIRATGHAWFWLAVAGHIVQLGAQPLTLRTGPLVFRESAHEAPLPKYPTEAALQGAEGQVLADVYVRLDGDVASVDARPGSDPRLAAAVVTAVKRWRFRQLKHPEPDKADQIDVLVHGRVLFYFTLFAGRPIVIDAAAAVLCSRAEYGVPVR